MAFTDFDSLLNAIHDDAALSDNDNHIAITANRRFEIPTGFEKVIAYEGDVNSQIITFKCPQKADGHDLSKCGYKRLRWANMASGNEGSSVLDYSIEGSTLILKWAAPAEAFTKAGQIRFSISIFDIKDGKTAYSWNTAECSELTVGASLETVGPRGEESEKEYIPAKDEILIINAEKRTITAPVGYRHMICNYGDVNTSVVYFQIKRYIRGIDVLAEGTQINIHCRMGELLVSNNNAGEETRAEKALYAVDLDSRDGEGLVNIIWKPTDSITNNQIRHTGKFRIQVEIISGGKVWRTSVYDDLIIGEGDIAFNIGDLPVVDNEGNKITGYLINGNGDFTNLGVTSVAGLVALRQFTLYHPITLHRNELAVEYDNTGAYVGIKIGTANGQISTDAPYVTTNPSTTILIQGGNSNP